jgi:hypothetical protein
MKANPAMQLAAALARRSYFLTNRRIRHWGSLPRRRGPTILITNHQHEDEGEVIFAEAIMRDPRIPMIAVNSRRTFETGFFAARMPWTAPLTRTFNPAPLWRSLGLLPIENHLHSRPLRSLAEEIRAKHGNLPLATILPGEVLAKLDLAGRSVADLWTPEYFQRGQSWVKLGALKQPYRREALENFRATMTADIADVVRNVEAGATFYVTPEGDMSVDGFMRPMRNGITDAVLPIATPWLCAIAYDPFRGTRLSMLYRLVEPANSGDLGTSLAAARAVTTSALLATYLCSTADAFAAEDARRAVRERLATLPANVFTDPELEADPDNATNEALTGLIRMGFLCARGTMYEPAQERTDPRFPHVADMLTFQRNMLVETLAAATRLR